MLNSQQKVELLLYGKQIQNLEKRRRVHFPTSYEVCEKEKFEKSFRGV